MTRILLLLLSLLVLILTGCGSQPLEHHEYLLRPPIAAASSTAAPEVRLNSVAIAPYLDQDGIVLRTGASKIHAGRQHTWAEPLDASIARFLQVAVGDAADVQVEVAPFLSGASMPEILVKIHQLHGTETGMVVIVAEWSISDKQGTRLHQFESQTRQQADGYAALVDAHAELLLRLAQVIAQELS